MSRVPAHPDHDFDAQLAQVRPWLVLLARLHLDARYQEAEASNIAQDVMVDMVKYREKLAELNQPKFQAWARKVVRHKIIDFYRKQRNVIPEADLRRLGEQIDESFFRLEQLAVASQTSPSQAPLKEEECMQLAAALEKLPADNREAVVLKDLAGWSLQEIANKLGCTVGVVAGRLRRGREALAAELDP